MSKQELSVVNDKITSGELFFFPGVPVEVKLKQAFVSDNSTYIYPVFDDIVLLKKETAIVPKNRTQNPLLRVSERIVEAFYNHYRLRRKDRTSEATDFVSSHKIPNTDLNELKKILPRDGGVLVSCCSDTIDLTHNLVFGLKYALYVHFDYSITRLRNLKTNLKDGSLLVLGDHSNLPFQDGKVSSLFSFDDISDYEKSDQKLIYAELKRVLDSSGSSVMLYNQDNKLHTGLSVKSDRFKSKAKSMFQPWKKERNAFVHFHPMKMKTTNTNIEESIVSETSLGGQLL